MSLLSKSYPKIAIIAITTHGYIKTRDSTDGKLSANDFKVPSGMTIVKYAEAYAGTCVFTESDAYKSFIDLISFCIPMLEERTNYEKKKFIDSHIAIFFRERNTILLNLLKKTAPLSSKHKRFINNYKLGNSTRIFSPGERIINKTFEIDEPVDYDNKIILLNAEGQPDLYKIISGLFS